MDASAVVLGLMNDCNARRLLATEVVAVPHLVDSEVTSALRSQVARRAADPGSAGTALQRWQMLGVRRYGVVGFLGRIWELRHNVTAYDATYVALAEALGCELITADVRLATAPGPSCPILVVS
ncbi:MAG: type II toxin-antitoxin system VapC family toxin [Acidimicrobiales bacterium]